MKLSLIPISSKSPFAPIWSQIWRAQLHRRRPANRQDALRNAKPRRSWSAPRGGGRIQRTSFLLSGYYTPRRIKRTPQEAGLALTKNPVGFSVSFFLPWGKLTRLPWRDVIYLLAFAQPASAEHIPYAKLRWGFIPQTWKCSLGPAARWLLP